MNKEEFINYLLCSLMDKIFETNHHPKVVLNYSIEACLRFAVRAASKIGISYESLLKTLEEQRKWNENHKDFNIIN